MSIHCQRCGRDMEPWLEGDGWRCYSCGASLRATTPESARALEVATLPDPEPRDPELLNDDGIDV